MRPLVVFMLAVCAPEVQAAHCADQDLELFVRRAQELDRAALVDGVQLAACDGSELRAAALQWQAFLMFMTGDIGGSYKVDDLPPPVTSEQGRAILLARARAGVAKDLLRQIDSGGGEYSKDAEAQLTLARVLARKGQFARARAAYLAFRRLRPAGEAAAAEYLYTYLWEGDLAGARAAFAHADELGHGAAFTGAVQRGLHLLEVNPGSGPARSASQGQLLPQGAAAPSHPPAPVAPPATPTLPVPPNSAARADTFASSGLLTRQPGKLVHRQLSAAFNGAHLTGHVSAHALDEQLFGAKEVPATDAGFGAYLGSLDGSALALDIGYFSLGSAHWYGSARAQWETKAPRPLRLEAAIDRQPVALTQPLPSTEPETLGLMRDALHGNVLYGDYLMLNNSLEREAALAAAERHDLLVRLPLTSPSPALGVEPINVALRIPGRYELHPRPNPNYATEPQTVLLGAGIGVSRGGKGSHLPQRWSLSGSADYQIAAVTLRSQPRKAVNSSIGAAELAAAWALTAGWRLELSGRVVRLPREVVLPADVAASTCKIAVAWQEY